MKQGLIFLIMLASGAIHAQDNCVLQERSVSRAQVTILERSTVRRDIVPAAGSGRKCMVDFRVRIGANWHTAFGEHIWDGNQSSAEACAIAVDRAESAVRDRVGQAQTVTERTLVCKDRPELMTLKNTLVGQVGDAGQFRPHPDRPNRFWHNGAQCRWFVEPTFTNRNIHNFQGIVCEVQPDRWVVVDKF